MRKGRKKIRGKNAEKTSKNEKRRENTQKCRTSRRNKLRGKKCRKNSKNEKIRRKVNTQNAKHPGGTKRKRKQIRKTTAQNLKI